MEDKLRHVSEALTCPNCGVVFSRHIMGTRHEYGFYFAKPSAGSITFAVGLIILGTCWFFGQMPGALAGGFIAIIGAILRIKR